MITTISISNLFTITLTNGGGGPAWLALLSSPTIVGVVVTAGLGLVGVLLTNNITGRLRDQELYLKACEFLKGGSGTQSRAIGIALLRNYAENGYQSGRRKEAAAIMFKAQMFHLEKMKKVVRRGNKMIAADDPIEAFNYFAMDQILKEWSKDGAVPTIVTQAETEGRARK